MAMKPGELETLIGDTVSGWYARLDALDYARKVEKRLDACYDSVVLKLLGFRGSSWGRGMEVDACNGRSGNSFVGEHVMAKAKVEADLFFEKCFERIDPEELITNQVLDALTKDFNQRFQSALRSRVLAQAEARAVAAADMIVEMVAPSADDIKVPSILAHDAKLRLVEEK